MMKENKEKTYYKQIRDSKIETTIIVELIKLVMMMPSDHWLRDFLNKTIIKIRKGKIKRN